MNVRLSEQEVREILARAEELHGHEGGSDTDSMIRAAEEAGLSREAVERAIRERLQLPTEPPATGDLVFAKSGDGCYYVSEVLETRDSGIRVRFLKGGEHTVAQADVRRCSLLPGERVSANWKGWGWAPATIVSYTPSRRKVKVTDWWSEQTMSVGDLRLEPPKKPRARGQAVGWIYAAGVATGSLLTYFGYLLFG